MPEGAPVYNDVITKLGVEESFRSEKRHTRAQVIVNAGKINLNFKK